MMAFSSSFFSPDLAQATPTSNSNTTTNNTSNNQPQLDEDPQTIKKESPTSTGEGNPGLQDPSPPAMPHSERAQSASSTGAPDVEMADDMMGDTANSASKPAASKKKKGTAAAVKAPSKRARPGTGGAKKAKGGASKKPKTDAPTKHSGDGDTADGGNSSESDNGPYCLCRGPDDHRFMIACDRCEDWFHGECIGMDKHTGENLVQKYICPNCTEGGRYATRYKKMCSLAGCANPARIYDAARPSIFCSADHCQAWWEQLIASLPRTKNAAAGGAADHLTQEEFMGLLDAPLSSSSPSDGKPSDPSTSPWHLGQPPFSTPPNFWDSPASSRALTPEEQTLLTTSATARYQLGEEIVLCKKMLQLIDMALKQREAAIAAGKGTAKDLCGYDFRLDTVGATHQFARFLQSPQGETIFKTGRLDAPETTTTTTTTSPTLTNGITSPSDPTTTTITNNTPPEGEQMCPKKKCKPHNGWSAILTKTVRHDMKELAAQAKELLDAEQRVRDGAAGRFRRRIKEGNAVLCLDLSSSSSS